MIENGKADLNNIDNNGRSPLYYASMNGHIEVVKFLVECGANIHQITNSDETIVYKAHSYGHQDVVEFLLEKGAKLCES